MKWRDFINPELHDPINAAGAAAAVIGGLATLGLLFGVPDWIIILSLLLWVIGIGILAYHSNHRDKNN